MITLFSRVPWVMMPTIMILAGCLGGVANYLLFAADDPRRGYKRSVALGVIASLMVPLFLYVVQSKILDSFTQSERPPVQEVFVFFGLCLVAGASSTAFIRTVSGSVLKELEQKVGNVRSDVKLMMDGQIEREAAPQKSDLLLPVNRLDEKAIRILKELANGQFLLRTRTSLAKETDIDKSEVDRIVSELARKGLVGNRMVAVQAGQNRRRWFITAEGRAAIANPIPVSGSQP